MAPASVRAPARRMPVRLTCPTLAHGGGRMGWRLERMACLGLALAAAVAGAAELRRGEVVEIPAHEVVQEDLYVLAQRVRVLGRVEGDLVLLAQEADVDGTVTGDLLGAARTLRVRGEVGGSARVVGAELSLQGKVGRDALGAGRWVEVQAPGAVGGDAWLAGYDVRLSAPVRGGARVTGQAVAFGGPVGGEVRARAGTIDVGPGATLGGPFHYVADRPATLQPGASVAGPVEAGLSGEAQSAGARALRWAWGWGRLLVGITLAGLLLAALAPGLWREAPEALRRAPLRSFGLGAVALLLAVPVAVAAWLLGAWVGGGWMGPVLLLALGVAVGLTPPVVGRTLGEWIQLRGVAALVLGAAVLALGLSVPLVGALVALAMVVLGTGALLQAGTRLRARRA